jgi:hypothetical protein
MTMVKFDRNYFFQAEVVNQASRVPSVLTIEPPFSIYFDITRNLLNSANVCQIRFYNLSEANRNQLYYNQSDYPGGFFRQIQLKAGYGTNLATVFLGNMTQAWSVREGVNFITQIECMDGGDSFINDYVSLKFPAKTPIQTIILTLMSKLTNVTVGGVGKFEGKIPRSNTYAGNPSTILFEITGGGFFIDNGKAYAMRTDEYIPDLSFQSLPTAVVSDATGLLNTPVLERTFANFEMLFEPTLNPGRLVSVQSLTFPKLNRTYKIYSVKHRGVISPVMSGNLITNGGFYANSEGHPLNPITVIPR